MLKMLLFIAILPFAFVEAFVYQQFGIVVVGTLYFLLSAQAEHAANRFLRDGLVWPEKKEPKAPVEKGPVSWLHEEKTEEVPRPAPEQPKEQARAKAPPKPQAPPKQNKPASPLPRRPNYAGQPHEVLAVPESAATRTIKAAFRFWVKQMHPDHNPGQPAELLNRRTQKITEAKAFLLRRRSKKEAA